LERDSETIPRIDGYHGRRQIYKFLVAKILTNSFIESVGYVIATNLRHRFSPFKRRPFAVREEWSLAPSG
jgi:hypothetical protein